MINKIDINAEYFIDACGYKVNWRDENDGWDEYKRKSLISTHETNLMVPPFVPLFSETGLFH